MRILIVLFSFLFFTCQVAAQDELLKKISTDTVKIEKVKELSPMENLKDADPKIRRMAVMKLGKIYSEGKVQDKDINKKKAAVKELKNLLKDKDPQIRSASAKALNKIDPKETLKDIIAALKREKDRNPKVEFIRIIGESKDHINSSIISDYLKDEDPIVRTDAVAALGKIEDPETYNDIVNMLDDKSEGVRVVASGVIGNLKIESASDKLIELLDDKNNEVRYFAADALSKVAKIEHVKAVKKRLKVEEDEKVKSVLEDIIKQLSKEKP
ncbi:MAG: HEAT repeat domain-containing protein [bacterium]